MVNPADLTGYVAAILTTFSFVPQLLRVWRTRSVADISLGMYTMYTVGIAIWLAYGIMIMSWPVIVSNFITLIFAACVLAMKIRFGR